MRNLLSATLVFCVGSLLGVSASAADCRVRPLKVGIDIGHAIDQPGARSATGRFEFFYNRTFARELVDHSKSRPGLDLVLLNPGGERIRLAERPERAATIGADVFVSIHHDSVNAKYLRKWRYRGRAQSYSDAFEGYSLFVAEEGRPHVAESRRLGETLGRRLKDAGFKPSLHHAEPIPGENRKLVDAASGLYEAPFVVVTAARMPAVLVEVGVLVHRAEERRLQTAAYRQRIADAILAGLEGYCSTPAPL